MEEQVDEVARNELTPEEMAQALGIRVSTFRAMIARAHASATGLAFAPGDRRNPWNRSIHEILRIDGPRSRRFVFSQLDLSQYHPDQVAAMRAILRTRDPRTRAARGAVLMSRADRGSGSGK